MSLNNDMDVVKLIEKYRKRFPNAQRKELRAFVRLDYEKYRHKHRILDTGEEKTFLRKLDRKLAKMFPRLEKVQPKIATVESKRQAPSLPYAEYFEQLQDIGKVGSSEPNLGMKRLETFILFLPENLRLEGGFLINVAKVYSKNPQETFMEALGYVVEILKRSEKEQAA